MITIKVPATSANLGPGFDTLGVALQLYATFKVQKSTTFQISGCPPAYANENNLFHKAYLHRVKSLKLKPKVLQIEILSEIPVARGLGSSASFIIAGMICAHLIHDVSFTLDEIAFAASQYESHPDNVCAAIYGGLCASLIGDQEVLVEKFEVHPSIHFYYVIPNFELLTSLTRLALPDKVLMEDAVYNLSRIPLLLKAIEKGDQTHIDVCIQDTLHQTYRYPLIYQSESVLAILEDHGIKSCYISGAGPTIGLILNHRIDVSEIQEKLSHLRHSFKLIELKLDTQGSSYWVE